MNQKTRKIVLFAFLIYAGCNLFTYLIGHVALLIKNDVLGAILEYLELYLNEALTFLFTPLLACLMLILYVNVGMSKSIIAALIISLGRIFYVLPATYMEYVYSYDSLEALVFGVFAQIEATLLIMLEAVAMMWLAIIVLQKVCKKSYNEIVESMPGLLTMPSSTDFLAHHNLPVLAFVLLKFTLKLIGNLVYTVLFFISYGSDYSGLEIVTMLINYVLLFVLLILSYLLTCRIKDKLAAVDYSMPIADTEEEQDENEEKIQESSSDSNE